MSRPWRKDRIFRFYLGGYVLVSSALVWFFFRSVEASHKRQVDILLARVDSLEKRSGAVSSSPLLEVAKTEDDPENVSSPPPPLFYVEGSGYNRRWAYMDIAFLDGARRRYYFRPFPSRRELAELHRRLEHDAYAHYYYLDESSES